MGTVYKALAGKQDLALYDGDNTARTFERLTSTGSTQTLRKFDWIGVDVLAEYGSYTSFAGSVITTAIAGVTAGTVTQLWLAPGTWTLDANLTIPANIVLELAPGASFDLGAYTLTINGSLRADPNRQIFDISGGGTVTGTPKIQAVFPEWFGANGDKSGDDSAAVNAAIVLADNFIPVIFRGWYAVDSQIVFHPHGHYYALTSPTTATVAVTSGLYSDSGATTSFTLDGDGALNPGSSFGYGARFENIIFERADDTGKNFYIRDEKKAYFSGCVFARGSIALEFDSGASGTWYNTFNACSFIGDSSGTNSYIGVKFVSTGVANPNENYFTNCNWNYFGTNVYLDKGGHNVFTACAFENAWEINIQTTANGTSNSEFIGCRWEYNIGRNYAAGGRQLLNAAEATRIFGGDWVSSVLATTEFLEDTSTNGIAIIGDTLVSGYSNNFSRALYLRSDTNPQLYLNQGGTQVYSIDVLSNNFRIRDNTAGTNLINYIKSTGEVGITPPLVIGGTSGPTINEYDGNPENNVTADAGSICLNTTPATTEYALYIKRTGTGNTGWEGVGTVIP